MKYWFKKQSWQLLIVLGLLCSCGKEASSSDDRHQNQTMVINLSTEPPTLDPGMAIDVQSMTVLNMLFDGLTRMGSGPGEAPHFGVAERIEISSDSKTYTFHLRDTKWSNGDPVTAHDFEYAWKRQLSPSFPGVFAYNFYVIKGARDAKGGKIPLDSVAIRAVDDRTLVVELENPTPYFLELVQLAPFFPVHQASVTEFPDWAAEAGSKYVSNGPFLLNQWAHHNQLTVTRNPTYWDHEAVKLNKIIILMIGDDNTELSLFDKGELDWTGQPISRALPYDSIEHLRQEGRVTSLPIAAATYLVFNVQKPPFHHPKMRQALGYAINRRDIVTHVTKGGEVPITDVLPPLLTLQDAPSFRDGDIETARCLFQEGLNELGMTKDQLPPLVISYDAVHSSRTLLQAIQQQWKAALGIDVLMEAMEWKVFLDKLQGHDFSIAKLSLLAGYNDPYAVLHILKHGDSQENITGWEDPRFVTLLDAAERTRDTVHRDALLRRAEGVISEEMPIVPLYALTNIFMRHPDLRDYHITPIGWIDFKKAYFQNSLPTHILQ